MKTMLILILSFSSLTFAKPDATAYKGKYLLTRKESGEYPINTKCVRVGPKLKKDLEKSYATCEAWKGREAPLDEAIAMCDKGEGQKMKAYIFNDKKTCDGAYSDLSDGDAS